MTWLRARSVLRAAIRTALPGLRVIGMAYAGLIGMLAVVVVVSVAFMPVPPVLEEATQPARGAVGNIVQPATDAVTSIAGFRRVALEAVPLVLPEPTAALAYDSGTQDTGSAEAAAEPSAALETQPLPGPRLVPEAPAPKTTTTRIVFASPPAASEAEPDDAGRVAEDTPPEQPAPTVVASDRAPDKPAVVADPEIQQSADVETPKPLPPTPRPTETVAQTRARLDAENQAAIDAARMTLVHLKAEADAANQAAIDARKAAATAMLAATPRPALVTDVAKSTLASPHTRVAADAENEVQIDAAKTAVARARSEANAANQAAIDSARAVKFATPATPSTAVAPARVAVVPPPTSSEPAPTSVTEPAPVIPIETIPDPASVAPADERVFQQSEAPVMLAQDAPEA